MNRLTLLQWNACSLNDSRQKELQSRCSATDIDVILVCEARTKKRLKGFCDYLQFVNNDTLLLVHKSLQFQEVPEYNIEEEFIETIAIAIGSMLLIGAYCRDGSKKHGIQTLIKTIRWAQLTYDHICVIGDLNARCNMVYDVKNRQNAAGIELDRHLENEVLFCLNDGTITFSRPSFTPSVLDLCLVTKNLMGECESVQVKDWFDSDHKPLLCTFGRQKHLTKRSQYEMEYPIRALNLINKDLDGLCEHIDQIVQNETQWSIDDADELYQQIQSTILFGLKRNGLLRKRKSKSRKAWFTQEIQDLIRQRDVARLDNSPDALLHYNRLKKAVKRAVRKAKRQHWYDFVESIRHEDSPASIWNKFRLSRGIHKPFDAHGDLDRQTETIAHTFKKHSTVTMPTVDVWESKYNDVCAAWHNHTDDANDKMYNTNITIDEVRQAIRVCKSTSAPGPDGIPYSVYKCLPESLIGEMTRLFNMWYDSGDMATECDEGLQVAIPKETPGDFRPITLKNAITKIYERVLYSRIYNWIDQRLPDYQFGFRRKMGCADQLLRLVSHLQQQRDIKNTTVILFLDIRKAYDRVYRKALIAKLYDYGLRGKMLMAIDRLISRTRCRVLNQRHVSTEYVASDGIPQGGVLSCLLWNCFFSDLPCNIQQQQDNVMYAAYADDLAITVSAKTLHDANAHMTQIYSDIREWAKHNRVEFNDKKVKSMVIRPQRCRKRKNSHHDDTLALDRVLYLDETSNVVRRVDVVCEYRYLGAILDHKLSLSTWINKIVANAKRRIHLVKRLVKTMKLPRRLIEKLYDAYVRGYLRFGIEVWSQARTAHKVYNTDRAGQRMCAGLLHATRNESVEWESNFIPLHHIASFASIKLIHKAIRVNRGAMNTLARDAFDGVSTGSILGCVMDKWYCAGLPVMDTFVCSIMTRSDWDALDDMVTSLKPSGSVKQWVYRDSFWEEKVLSRFRAGVQPTYTWKKRVGLDWSDRCRHCKIHTETIEHFVLDECPALEHKFKLSEQFGIDSRLDLMDRLRREDDETRVLLEDHMIEVTRLNDLFARRVYDVG